MSKSSRKGSKENALTAEDLLNLNKRRFVITEATIKDEICNYNFEITGGIGIGEVHGVKGAGLAKDSLKEAFAKFNVHAAVLDEIFKHSDTEITDVDQMHGHEYTMLYRISYFKVKETKGYETVQLKGEKYSATASGWIEFKLPEVALDNLGGYQWYNELKTACDVIREEVAKYKEGNCIPVEEDEPKDDKNQGKLFSTGNDNVTDPEFEEQLEGAKV